jgi:hypothetical protein
MVIFFEFFVLVVEHLVQWFSSSNVNELQPTAISLDIQNPIIEIKLKQVKKMN